MRWPCSLRGHACTLATRTSKRTARAVCEEIRTDPAVCMPTLDSVQPGHATRDLASIRHARAASGNAPMIRPSPAARGPPPTCSAHGSAEGGALHAARGACRCAARQLSPRVALCGGCRHHPHCRGLRRGRAGVALTSCLKTRRESQRRNCCESEHCSFTDLSVLFSQLIQEEARHV